MSSEYPSDGYPRQAAAGAPPGAGPRFPTGGGQRAQQRAPGGVYGILHVIGGNDRGKQFALQLPETTIGRGADQDVVLADIAVSRRHVVVAMEGDRYRIRDLGSGNGTLINGVRTDTAILNDGDQIEIGNTVLKLEHAPSRAGVAAQPQPPPGMMHAAPENKTMIADAGVPLPMPQGYGQPQPPPGYPPQPAYGMPQQMQQMQQQMPPQMQPQMGSQMPQLQMPPTLQPLGEPIAQPPPQRPPVSALPPPINTSATPAPSGGLLNTTAKKVAVFGAIGLIVLLGGALVVKKFVLGGGGPGEAQKLLAEGKKAFSEHDYVNAKRLFTAAQVADPEMTQAGKLAKQCDVEAKALAALEKANGLKGQKKWIDVLKAVDGIDRSTQAYKDAEDLRKAAVPYAVEQYVEEAKDKQKDEPEEAQAKVDQALALDPENEAALALDKELKAAAGAKPAVAEKPEKPGKGEKPVKVAKVEEPPKKATPVAVKTTPTRPPKGGDDDDLAPVGKGKPVATAPSTGPAGAASDVLGTPAAGAYRNKDFGGAASALKAAARGPNGKAFESMAAQVNLLAGAYAKAESNKASNYAAAVSDYQQAMSIDAKVGRGTHAAYFKGQLGKTSKALAQQALSQGKYDVAFEAAKSCSKYGSDDGGVQAQLKAKAAQMNANAEAMKKTNLVGAKNLWRMVVRMVPPGDPAFVKASASLNQSQQTHSDEDE